MGICRYGAVVPEMYGFCVDIDGYICVSQRPCNVECNTSDVSYCLCGQCGDES